MSKGYASFGYYSLVPNRFNPLIPIKPINPIPPPPIPPLVPSDPGFSTFVLQNVTGLADSDVYVLIQVKKTWPFRVG